MPFIVFIFTSQIGTDHPQDPTNCSSPNAHAHPFNGPLFGTTRVSRYQTGKTNLDFTEERDSEWQWHQPGHMQVCTLLQTDMSAPHHSVFLQAGRPSSHPTNSVKAKNLPNHNPAKIHLQLIE